MIKLLPGIFILYYILICSVNSLSAPLEYVRDIYMASYRVKVMFGGLSGPGPSTGAIAHAPDIFPTTMDYKLFLSSSRQAEYTINSNAISIQVQITKINITHIDTYIYTDYRQSFDSVIFYRIQVLVIDVLSPAYAHFLPSTLRLTGRTLMSTSYSQQVSVSTFSSTSLSVQNNLVIYSFLVGFKIQSQNMDFQLKVWSTIINATTIKVYISSIVNLVILDLVRIDTVVIDRTKLTASKLMVLDFQTADCPTSPYVINYAYPTYSQNTQNLFTGLSHFYLQNKAKYSVLVSHLASSTTITVSSTSNFTRIVYTNLFFVSKKCPTGYPNFDKATQMCFTTTCIGKNYRVVTPQACLPCRYSCKTCQNGVNCLTCDGVTDFRQLNTNTLMCDPKSGYYDDGTSNSVAQLCISPCVNCIGQADNCTSCVNSSLVVDLTIMKCVPCSDMIPKCLTCTSTVTCTLSCLYMCQTCDDSISCTSCSALVDFRQLDSNTSLCVPKDGFFDDGTSNSVAQPCNFPCSNCLGEADNCTSCPNSQYNLDSILMRCILCSVLMPKCLECTDTLTCTIYCLYMCQTCDDSTSCTSCSALVDFRQLDSNTSLCVPKDGFFDDGTSNSVAQPCNFPCSNCLGEADNCTSCPNSQYNLDSILMRCILCSELIPRCLECSDALTCTLYCLYMCQTCDDSISCTSCSALVDFRQPDSNTSLCIPMDGHYDDGTSNSVAQPCNFPCSNCLGEADNCTSCPNLQYNLDIILMKCIRCSVLMPKCLECTDASTCTLYCLYMCQTCDDSISCTSCDSIDDFRQLDLSTSLCVPQYGYFDDGTDNSIAQPCNFPCSNCIGVADDCTDCTNSSYFLDLGLLKCHLCSDFILGCLECTTQHYCTVCSTEFSSLILADATICSQVCGDGTIFTLECDDGNIVNGDGCSYSCKIQPDYYCFGGSTQSPSTCVYNGSVDVKTINFLKDETRNTIYLRFQVSINMNLLDKDLNQLFVPNFPYESILTTFDSLSGQFLCKINYNKPLNSYKSLQVMFKVPVPAGVNVSSPSLNHPVQLGTQTDNNLALKVYSDGLYQMLQSLTYSSQILVYLSGSVCLLAWMAGQQLYSLELFFVIQYVYLGLLTIDGLEFSMVGFKPLRFSFGILQRILQDKELAVHANSASLPKRISSLGFSQQLTQNINLSFLVLFGIGIVGFLIYGVGAKFQLNTWKIQGKKMLCMWSSFWIFLIQIPSMVSIALSFKYEESSGWNFKADMAIALLYLMLLVVAVLYLLLNTTKSQKANPQTDDIQIQKTKKRPQTQEKIAPQKGYTIAQTFSSYLSQSHNAQSQNGFTYWLRRLYLFFSIVYKAVIVGTAVFLHDSLQATICCLLLHVLMLLYVCLIRPYQSNIRPIINCSMILVVASLYTYKKLMKQQQQVDFSSFYAVVGIIVLIYINLVANFYFISKQIIAKLTNCYQSSKGQNQLRQTHEQNNKTNETILNLAHQQNAQSISNDQLDDAMKVQYKLRRNCQIQQVEGSLKETNLGQIRRRRNLRNQTSNINSLGSTILDQSKQNMSTVQLKQNIIKINSFNNKIDQYFEDQQNYLQPDLQDICNLQNGVEVCAPQMEKLQIKFELQQEKQDDLQKINDQDGPKQKRRRKFRAKRRVKEEQQKPETKGQ